jgi:hypothetical protein
VTPTINLPPCCPGLQVALIAEEISGIGNEIQRQLLRTRRSFQSTVLSADGEFDLRVLSPTTLLDKPSPQPQLSVDSAERRR